MQEKSILELFSNVDSKEFTAALFLSYNFETEFFEQQIIPLFFKTSFSPEDDVLQYIKDINFRLMEKPISVIMDSNNYLGGKRISYELFLYKKRLFHPKLYILQFENVLRVIIGSANMTESGICKNAELITYFDISEDENNNLAYEIAIFLENIKSDTTALGEGGEAVLSLLKQYGKKDQNKLPAFVHTYMDRNILDTFYDFINTDIKSLKIMSPFYETDVNTTISLEKSLFSNVVDRLSENTKFSLYMPGNRDIYSNKWKVYAPGSIIKYVNGLTLDLQLYIVKNIWTKDSKEVIRDLHGKLISVETEEGFYSLMGSPNFTKAALLSNFYNKGNVECGIVFKEKKDIKLFNSQKVNIKNVNFSEMKETDNEIINIIESATLDVEDKRLGVTFTKDALGLEFDVYFGERKIFSSLKSKVEIYNLCNAKELSIQEIEIIYKSTSYFYPITVLDREKLKEYIITEGYQITFDDIISMYSGKYRNATQLISTKQLMNDSTDERVYDTDSNTMDVSTFKYNIRNFLKAIDMMRDKLYEKVWTEISFKVKINGPFSFNSIVKLIIEAVDKNTVTKQEGFFYLAEIYECLSKVVFSDDSVALELKNSYLAEIKDIVRSNLSQIYKKERKKKIKSQYKLILDCYFMEDTK